MLVLLFSEIKAGGFLFSSLAARGYTHFIKTNVGFLTHLGGMLVDNCSVPLALWAHLAYVRTK